MRGIVESSAKQDELTGLCVYCVEHRAMHVVRRIKFGEVRGSESRCLKCVLDDPA